MMAIKDYSEWSDSRVPDWVLRARIAGRKRRAKELKYNTCHCGTEQECLVHNMDRAMAEMVREFDNVASEFDPITGREVV
jgi:hypothetical protein